MKNKNKFNEVSFNLKLHKYKNQFHKQVQIARYFIIKNPELTISKTFIFFMKQHSKNIITPTGKIKEAFKTPETELEALKWIS